MIAASLYVTALPPGPPPGLLAWAGAGIWAAGFAFEGLADWQLLRFKRDPDREGRIMTGGLWAVLSPLTLTAIILFVSGIPMLEEKYRGDPEFEVYRERTSVFLPLPPREAG